MKLAELLRNIPGITIRGDKDTEITGICFDSRKAEKGVLFVAIQGNEDNGEAYVDSAIAKGAAAVLLSRDSSTSTGEAVRVEAENTRYALSLAASNFFGNPTESIKIIGITGTNGKTTTVTLLYHLFTDLGYKCGLLSTIENIINGKVYPASHTTPDPIELNRMLATMCQEGCEYCFMEVSSHSLDQERVAALKFKGAIFSNLTHDHLDYHKTFAEYIRCKKLLFDHLDKDAFALINVDDKNGEVMVQNCKAQICRYSCSTPANLNCKIMEKTIDGMLLNIDSKDVWTRFIGKHNAYNLLAVYGTAKLLGAGQDETLLALSNLKPVSGRLEYINSGDNILAVIDYAHTPDALENVLTTLKDIAGSKYSIFTVFGCGGDRDKSKRPEMGEIAARYSDKIFVTSDNPRSEEPEAIIADIKRGMDIKDMARSLFITDRTEAIRTAILTAQPGTIILVAGKGHETYQIIKGKKSHFDDREVIRDAFEQRKMITER